MGTKHQEAAMLAAQKFRGLEVTDRLLKQLRWAVHQATGLPVKCDRENNPVEKTRGGIIEIAVLDPDAWFRITVDPAEVKH